MSEPHFAKKMKKDLYGKLHSIQVIYPAGFFETALSEIHAILNDLWSPTTTVGEISCVDKDIFIRNIHTFAIIELMLRSQCLTDIRFIILETKATSLFSFEEKCSNIPWHYYLTSDMTVKLHAKSIASRLFHETAMKERLLKIVDPFIKDNDHHDKKTETHLYVNLYKNKLIISVSLAGTLLYIRGYRVAVKSSAPLREDAAAACIYQLLKFIATKTKDFHPDHILIPFSGTGTFAFEYWQHYQQFSPILLNRGYSLQTMPFFRLEHFRFLYKKAHDTIPNLPNPSIIGIDSSSIANTAFSENVLLFNQHLQRLELPLFQPTLLLDDFLKMDCDFLGLDNNVLLLLNPPYGKRFGNENMTPEFYANIASKINSLAKQTKQMAGCILCPTESSWRAFSKNLKQAKTETYHFTQGGLDIRVCQFFI